MNKLKIGKTKKFLLVLLILSSVLVMPFTSTVKGAVINPDPWVLSVDIVFEGYQPDVSLSMLTLRNNLVANTIYNASIPDVGLTGTHFFEEEINSKDLQTDGITRTFSSSIASEISYESAGGLYQTLQVIDENDFSQYSVDRETTTFSFTTEDAYNKTITEELEDVDPDWTYLNFTCAKMYYVITFDRTAVDAFFTQAKAKATYAEIAETYSTNKQMITTLLDEIFTDHIFDIIYAPVNISTYASTWTIADEVRAVMGGNATDTSFNGTTKMVSIRNAIVGYIGHRIAPTTVIEAQGLNDPFVSSGLILGLEQTATTYSITLDVKQDFCTANTVDGSLAGFFGILQPGQIETGVQVTYYVGMGLLIGLAAGFVAGLIALVLAKNNKNKAWITFAAFIVVTAITFVLYIVFTLALQIT